MAGGSSLCYGIVIIVIIGTFDMQVGAVEYGEVRLVGGDCPTHGRVEIYFSGWGTVDNGSFTDIDARVVCKELGYPYGLSVVALQGSGRKWLSNVNCQDSHKRLKDCRYTKLRYSSSSRHTTDAGVQCFNNTDSRACDGSLYPAEYSMKLEKKTCNSTGQLMVFIQGTYLHFCSYSTSGRSNEQYREFANVACENLGYNGRGYFDMQTSYINSVPKYISALECSNFTTISNLSECSWTFTTSCSSSYRGRKLVCFDENDRGCDGKPYPVEGDVRLSSGRCESEGRLDIFHDGIWGTICKKGGFNNDSAEVACKIMGYETGMMRRYSSWNGKGQVWLTGLRCRGSCFANLLDCDHSDWGDVGSSCSHSYDVELTCYNYTHFRDCSGRPIPYEGALALVAGKSHNSGRLEIFHNGRWGSICDDGFGVNGAKVACTQLGYHNGKLGGSSIAPYGSGTTWLDEVRCSSYHKTISECSHRSWGYEDCSRDEDVRLTCTDEKECDSSPCHNNGSCTDGFNRYTCMCLQGFAGADCTVDINECDVYVDPCEHGGTCIDDVADFNCLCMTGYEGKNCSTETNECQSNPCANNGTCTDRLAGFTCACAPGFTDTFCETEINECLLMPCHNGGSCIDRVGDFECKCATGYSGKVCDTNIDECGSNPCQNNATCLDGNNWYFCKCIPGYHGHHCEISSLVDECASSPCQNNGSCIDGDNWYVCKCPPGYSGRDCQISPFTDECASNPCQNGGTCFDGNGWYVCKCTTDFSGHDCQIPKDQDECASNPCQNGGTCLDGNAWYVCKCPPDFQGHDCESPRGAGLCDSQPCQNNGTCMAGDDWYVCKCPGGYNGVNCEAAQRQDECASLPCVNGGTCYDGDGWFICKCPQGFGGDTCQHPLEVDECSSNPCRNGGTCMDGNGWFVCRCRPGYSGDLCQTAPKPSTCTSNPCQNGGRCLAGEDWYVCQCPPTHTGHNCQTFKNQDRCDSNPCQNNGTCYGGDKWYICKCIEGYSGEQCQLTVNATIPGHCDSNPCQNGGTCLEGDNWYVCKCPPTFLGDHCQTAKEADACDSNPCQNGGTCLSGDGWYVCKCPEGVNGNQCEQTQGPKSCDSNPCANGGQCMNGDGWFVCKCADGFSGPTCQVQEASDPCLSDPCLNNGTCLSAKSWYHCKCLPEYTGDNCQVEPAPKKPEKKVDNQTDKPVYLVLWIVVGAVAFLALILITYLIIRWRRRNYLSKGKPVHMRRVNMELSEDTDIDDFESIRGSTVALTS